MMRIRRRPAAAAGFTLIELLVVVAIIGILVAAATPGLLNALDRSRQASTVANLRAIGNAIQIYHNDNNFYPQGATVADFLPAFEQFGGGLKAEDAWYHPIGYASEGVRYSVVSYGKDGIDGEDVTYETRHVFTLDIVYDTGSFAAAID
jgi:general secretion pathway protein G